jgi:uncharacterized damage-inducible protein DinB
MIGYGGAELANAFRTVRRNTVQIAEDIPEDQYDFTAVPGMRSVRHLLMHIAHATMMAEDMHRERRITTLKGYDFGAAVARANAEEAKSGSKAQIVALLKANGEAFASWLESLTPAFLAETFTDPAGQNPRTRFESLLAPKEHEMHHRAQLMLIERMLGIVPHLTRQREERVRQRQAAARS